MVQLPFGNENSRPKPIYARSGWEIPQPSLTEINIESRNQSLADVRRRTDLDMIERGKNNKSELKIRSLSPYMYNCVGMIFSHRRAWIDIDHIYDILREDGYNKISIHQVSVGDVVVYRYFGEPSHVALITDVHRGLGNIITIKVISKWGKDGEMEHLAENVLVNCGEPTEYYSEKIL